MAGGAYSRKSVRMWTRSPGWRRSAATIAALLEEDGAVGLLEEDIVAGVAGGEFGFDFAVEVVGGIFGFPVAVGEAETVEESAVELDLVAGFAFAAVFGDELPTEPAGAGFEEGLEGGADGAFVFDAETVEFGEGVVVVLDDFVGGLEVEMGHSVMGARVLGG